MIESIRGFEPDYKRSTSPSPLPAFVRTAYLAPCFTIRLFPHLTYVGAAMKRLFTLPILAIVTLLPVLSTAQQPVPSQEMFFQLQHQWAEARKHADINFLEKFYAKEFTVGLM